ncbi:MAG: 4-hydroxy-3-methylbut-2-enyl diphosphate reductase, partial [Mailhella sp.]|nr:4-hydroxy-3-methylbut-2-enyl diphosphate reductase [Mailhella sp.]
MEVIRAGKAGFCMGVALALHKLDTIVESRRGMKVATLGEIIHNPQVLESYAAKGVVCLKSADDADEGMSVLIRAHGIPRAVEEKLRTRCPAVEDATCPRVKKAQTAIAGATAEGRVLLLYGEADHPEVRGLISYAAGESRIFSSEAALDALLESEDFSGRNLVLAAQTTQDRFVFDAMKSRLEARFGGALAVLDTICDATRERQEDALDVAGRVQAMVIVGGRTSGNTRRLAELTSSAVPAVLVETADELDMGFFEGMERVGLTAGAST